MESPQLSPNSAIYDLWNLSALQLSLVSGFVATFLLVVFALIRGRRGLTRRGSSVLLVGPSDAGKTAILTSVCLVNFLYH